MQHPEPTAPPDEHHPETPADDAPREQAQAIIGEKPTVIVEPNSHTPDVYPVAKGQDDIFAASSFKDLGLRNSVLKGIDALGFKSPTTIQAQLIPLILSGKDVLGQAKTGTGKTAAFGLPLIHGAVRELEFQTLILVPTRELAIQVATDMANFARFTPIKISAVFGGEQVRQQAKRLARGPEIIVATPGRIMDMAERGHMKYGNVRHVVLDEVDRMLDIGFREDIRRILKSCPAPGNPAEGGRQTIFVSATLSPEIENLARSYARDVEKMVVSTGSLTVSRVKQFHLPVAPWDKKQLLLHLLTHEEPTLTIVFCRTKKTVDSIAKYIHEKGLDAHAIHGDMYQSTRNKVIDMLRKGKLAVLVASDLASRGLDVEGVTHVVNYDLPDDPDLYIHRIGRTARAGRDGVAWSLVTPDQGELLTQIEVLINAEIPKLHYPDFKPGPVPRDVLDSQALDAKRVEVAQSFNRFANTAPKPVQPAAVDPNKFPGGIVPTKLPPKRMQGKVKTTRSLREAIAQTISTERPPEEKK